MRGQSAHLDACTFWYFDTCLELVIELNGNLEEYIKLLDL